ncbi:MAG: hypothetical protein U0414_27655 [Polyangiaceae bacterium]
MRSLVVAFLGLTTVACAPSLEAVVVTDGGKVPDGATSTPTPAQRAVAEGFVALGKKDGVTLYKREAERGLEFAVEGDLPASPERVRRVMLDYPAHTKWQERLAECKVLARGDDWADVYERLSLPMLDDRDYTLHVTWGADGDVLWSRFTTANDKGPPEVDGVVRVTLHEGSWTFAPIQEGKATHAFYRFHLDIDSSFAQSLGSGSAQGEMIDLFAQITAELPSYP